MIIIQLWELWEHRHVLSDFLNNCPEDVLIDALTSLRMLQEDGNLCSSVVSENLAYEGLLSLKARAKKLRVRMIYFFAPNRRAIFVDVIIKKQRALPPADLKNASRRKKDIVAGAEEINVITLPA